MVYAESKGGRVLAVCAYSLLIAALGLILFLSLTKPQHNLFPWQMAIGTFLGFFVLIAAFFIWNRQKKPRIAEDKRLYILLLSSYGIMLYVISCIGRTLPDSLGDYGQVWNAAAALASGAELSEESLRYFSIYSNNIKPMLILSAIFRLAAFLGFQDPFYVVLFVGAAGIIAAVAGGTVLLGTLPERQKYRIPLLLMFAAALPVWANVQTLYTDGLSFSLGIVVLALLKLSISSAKWRRYLFLASAGLLAGLGMAVKVTIAIPLIAGFIVFCYKKLFSKFWIPLLFLLISAGTYEMTTLWAGHYEIWETAKKTEEPVIAWIALGLKADGSWSGNQEYYLNDINLSSKEEKIEYAKKYIWENRREFVNVSHLVQKARHNFASGSFGTKDYTQYTMGESNIIWEAFSPWGKYYWRTSQLCFCYAFAIYAVYLAGGILTVTDLIQKRKISSIKMTADLTLLGYIVFLMIWEANNRQLYNHLPMLLLGAVMNARRIAAWIEQKANGSDRIPSIQSQP